MFTRGWSYGFAIGISVGGFIAVGFLVWIVGLNYCPGQPCNNDRSPTTNPGQYEYYIPFSTGPNSSPGLDPADTKGHPNYYEHKDLRAQESVARATNALVWLTLISGVLSGVGAGLLVWTLYETRKSLKLEHPPRFKVTRVLATPDGDKGFAVPRFMPGETIKGIAYAMNYGRYTATIQENDCRFYWAKGGVLPMNHAYFWLRDKENFNRLVKCINRKDVPLDHLTAGDFGRWPFITTVPDDFTKSAADDGKVKWSHDLFVLGMIRYIGAADDRRGYYFCKRYSPEKVIFEDVPEYETED